MRELKSVPTAEGRGKPRLPSCKVTVIGDGVVPPSPKLGNESTVHGQPPPPSKPSCQEIGIERCEHRVDPVPTREGGGKPRLPSCKVTVIGDGMESPSPKLGNGSTAHGQPPPPSPSSQKSRTPRNESIAEALAVLVVALVGFWLYVQLSGLIGIAVMSSGWRSTVAWILVLLPITAFVWAIWKLWQIFRLPKIEQQVKGSKDVAVIKTALQTKYLKEICRSSEHIKNYVLECEFENSEAKIKTLARLSSGLSYADSKDWLDDFERFQDVQVTQAKKEITHYCGLIAVKTAVSPWKMIDMVCVVVNSTLMIAKIAKIFNRELSRPALARLAIRWCVNIYISGELGDATEKVASALGESFKDSLTTEGVFGNLLGFSLPVVVKCLGKVAEGGANAVLAYRLGNRAIEEFKALKEKEA